MKSEGNYPISLSKTKILHLSLHNILFHLLQALAGKYQGERLKIKMNIGDGAVIGTRAVVIKDVPPYTIVGGIPAKPVRKRFPQETIDSLLKNKWWDWSREHITQYIAEIQAGDIKCLL